MSSSSPSPVNPGCAFQVRPLRKADLTAADRVFRLAFGTFVGMPEPERFAGDADYVTHRWRANPEAAFAAVAGDELIGSNFAESWGSVGYFGPLTIHPAWWDKGVGKCLIEPAMALFEQWGTVHQGLFTFAHSAKHVGLYGRYGFRPKYLTAAMARQLDAPPEAACALYSALPPDAQPGALAACRELTESVLAGLDLSAEIRTVAAQQLGDTVLVEDGAGLAGLAVCHTGPGSEGGSGVAYVKFAAIRPWAGAAGSFARLLAAVEAWGASRGATSVLAGVNYANEETVDALLAAGYRTQFQGVAMSRSSDPGYHRRGIYALSDWR